MALSNPIHIAFLLVVLLLVFGAKRLPEMGRSLGAGMRDFKDAVSGAPDSQVLVPAPEAPSSGQTAPPPAVATAPVTGIQTAGPHLDEAA
jgi:sec-independent protein translocase protein TatA